MLLRVDSSPVLTPLDFPPGFSSMCTPARSTLLVVCSNACVVESSSSSQAFLVLHGAVFVAGKGETRVAVDKLGRLFSWSKRKRGVEALGRLGPWDVPTRITRGVRDVVFTSVACGEGFCVANDRVGRVFWWGRALGKEEGEGFTKPTTMAIPGNANIVSLAAGNDHCIALTSDLRVFAIGSSPANGLELDSNEFTSIEALCALRESDPVNAIACGAFHTVVSTQTRVMTFGQGKFGKLGTGNEYDTFEPFTLLFIENGKEFHVTKGARCLSAGANNTVVLLEDFDTILDEPTTQTWVFGSKAGIKSLVVADTSDTECYLLPIRAARLDSVGMERVVCGDDCSFVVTARADLTLINSNALENVQDVVGNKNSAQSKFLDVFRPLSESVESHMSLEELRLARLSRMLWKEQNENKLLKENLKQERSDADAYRTLRDRALADSQEAREFLDSLNPNDYQSESMRKVIHTMTSLHARVLELEGEVIRLSRMNVKQSEDEN